MISSPISNINILESLEELSLTFSGDILTDDQIRTIYATDASVYKQWPMAVALPKTKEDISQLVVFAKHHNTSLIPRTAGTSLAGQVVGGGIVVDMSKYMTQILEVNPKEKWVKVQPGVVLDELNKKLKQHGLFFSPETSTSNRCMMGGMVGNNSCGAHSLVYGSTRDHLLSVSCILSDGKEAEFKEITKTEFEEKLELKTLEGEIYRNIYEILSDPVNQMNIKVQYPDKEIKRRNTGYAIDLLLEMHPFTQKGKSFNFSTLIAGSEGTLCIITEIKLKLDPLPPPVTGLVCIHCNTLEEALRGNLVALNYQPVAVELMDGAVMELSKQNIEQNQNRFFIQGGPQAMLMVEFAKNSRKEIEEVVEAMEREMRKLDYGYHFPVLYGTDIPKAWAVRKAGLGLLSNMPGDAKPVPVVEDVAVNPQDLPQYIADFKNILDNYKLDCVYYAHIGTGELHLRPILNLKEKKDVELFREIARDTAHLVKKYNGSLSGEHGDGRLRGEFIPVVIGDKNYKLLKSIKRTWDPESIFNAGKIVDTPEMNTSLRYLPDQVSREFDTIFDFSENQGLLRGIEKCNGSGDCRKSEIIGGTMCPSYMATRDEYNTTRARANMLREYLSVSGTHNPFNSQKLYDVLDLCISCKGCKSECPSNVDMAKFKAEFLYQYYKDNKIPLRNRIFANIHIFNWWGSYFPKLFNAFLANSFTSGVLKKVLKIAPGRSFPKIYKTTLKAWLKTQKFNEESNKIYLFVDEFTNYNDVEIGIKAIKLLTKLNYQVVVPDHVESGRTFISKGLLEKARELAIKNVVALADVINDEVPLIGIEPSAILSFRDEYPDLVGANLKKQAVNLGKSVFLVEEFLADEIEKGNIHTDKFTSDKKLIKLHGHCQQKSIASTESTKKLLSFPANYEVEEINSGCCGMAGSFGYEKEHYDLSMKIGELVLFPEVRNTDKSVLITASGTSCRHQIKDGTTRQVLHPIEILFEALK